MFLRKLLLGGIGTKGGTLKPRYLAVGALGFLAATLYRKTQTRLSAPGRGKTLKTKGLEAGAAVFQSLTPVQQFNLYLDGFHFQSGDLNHQMRACHYCTILNEDLIQCVIFDGPDRGARLIGVEYIVSEALFKTLPEDEKTLWHSHRYEVSSGQLIAPGLPAWAELELMDKVRTTYGKTWHTWDTVHAADLPLGVPKLMVGFTEEGQIQPELVAARERLLGLSTAAARARRSKFSYPPPLDGADAWEKGEVLQIELTRTGMSFGRRVSRNSRPENQPQ